MHLADEFDFDKTKVLRDLGFPRRNLGSVQMSTDTAVKVTKLIIEEKRRFEDLKFIDRPSIKGDEHESLILNFRFLRDDYNEPIIADGIRELLLADADEFESERLE